MKRKQELGQFFTTNQDYILTNMKIPDNVLHIIEPFAGEGHLLDFIASKDKYVIECYDIEAKKDYIVQKDTIKFPPSYMNKFIITNPPYLARNKCIDKKIFDLYGVNDLYKCFLKNLVCNHCVGGILIVPLNFWSSIRKNDILLRKSFLEQYKVIRLNIFEENVFDDTSYTVCSFQFEKKPEVQTHVNQLSITMYPSKNEMCAILNDNNNYLIGGDIYHLPIKGEIKVTRLTKKNMKEKNTNILVKCIDDNLNSKICLSIVSDEDVYIDMTPNQTARTYATLIIEPRIEMERQTMVVNKFNTLIEEHRKKYNSLFLSNYRESKDLARKRISFELIYSIVEHILDTSV